MSLKFVCISAVAPFLVTLERGTVITFSQPYGTVFHRLFIKKPLGYFQAEAFIYTMESWVWIVTGIFWIVSAFALTFAAK